MQSATATAASFAQPPPDQQQNGVSLRSLGLLLLTTLFLFGLIWHIYYDTEDQLAVDAATTDNSHHLQRTAATTLQPPPVCQSAYPIHGRYDAITGRYTCEVGWAGVCCSVAIPIGFACDPSANAADILGEADNDVNNAVLRSTQEPSLLAAEGYERRTPACNIRCGGARDSPCAYSYAILGDSVQPPDGFGPGWYYRGAHCGAQCVQRRIGAMTFGECECLSTPRISQFM